MDIRIAEYEPWMAQTLAKMWTDSNDDWGGGNDIKTPGQVAQRIEGSSIMHHYVALAGDEAVGYASLGRYFGDADALYIELLGVRPDYQGKKVGKALVLKCVARTIELDYPRLDIHTWPGNTSAMPLYKKCGYLWEDRADSTHLVNFIPEIIKTPLFKPFFEKADWYADSTRSWDIVPDGVKENKFEVFGYSWAKDGETLKIGYERTGRRMRLVETNDYRIELIADDHELAFGLSYGCRFTVTNLSGKALHVKINGRQDKNIRFDYSLDTTVTGIRVFPAQFYVGEIDALQDKWKVHPCLLADVEINGAPLTFGLGICAKYPLTVTFSSETKVQQIGMQADCLINITSALAQEAEVRFALGENRLADAVSGGEFTARIPAKGKTALAVTFQYKAMGYEAAPTRFDIALADGTQFSFSKPLHTAVQDLTHAFAGEDDLNWYIANGPWRVSVAKHDGEAQISHLTNSGFSQGWFNPPKLGKPFDDEFNLLKPSVRSFKREVDIVMEAQYSSGKFPGMVLTMVYTLHAAGIVTRHYRAENRGNAPREMFLNDSYWLALGGHTIFKYRGQFTQNHDTYIADGPHYGIDVIDPKLFEENWLFEAAPAGARGFCWSPEVKPGFQWGNMMIIENKLGLMEPGDTVETPPVVCIYGLFASFTDFRNYAMGLTDSTPYIPARRVEVCLNAYNPFVSGENSEATLAIMNQRETALPGKITVSSVYFDTQTIVNEDEDEDEDDDGDGAGDNNDAAIPVNQFIIPTQGMAAAADGIAPLRVDMALSTYFKSYNRVLFTPSGKITNTADNTLYTVDNGAIAFRADSAYGPVCFSLMTSDGTEWLTHQYPEHKPFAWFNPFLGGIRVLPPEMNAASLLKEKTHVNFTRVADNHGNTWEGLRVSMTIAEEDALRGAVYETYYVTQPGLPLLCTFYRFINNTGVYRSDWITMDGFISPAEKDIPFSVEITDRHGTQYHMQFGAGADMGEHFINTAKVTGPRVQKLYLFHGNKNNGKSNGIDGDSKFPLGFDIEMQCHAAPGKTFTSGPVFILLTERDLERDALDDLERIRFL